MKLGADGPERGTPEALSRRGFLIRGIAVAGGAIALPVLAQEPASCSVRSAGVTPAPSTANGGGQTKPYSEDDLRAVTDNILCEGGCGKTVYTGELTDSCAIATQMRAEAEGYLSQGLAPQQTLARFVEDFGEGVLAYPSKSGFNLLAWLIPLAGLGVGGVAIAGAASNWRKVQPSTEQLAEETDPGMLSRIDEEVREDL